MSEYGQSDASAASAEDMLRGELAHCDAIIASSGPIVRHLLLNDDQTLFNDEVTARIRGMIADIARQLLSTVQRQIGVGRPAFSEKRADALALSLLENTVFLSHLHALAVEALVSERLSVRSGIDPVRSPLLVELAVSPDAEIAAAARHALAAQARFMQQQRRMELAFEELPQELFDISLASLDDCLERDSDAVADAASYLRDSRDPTKRRIYQFSWLMSALGTGADQALEIDRAGVGLFVTALSIGSYQTRETAILSLGQQQSSRLTLSMRAAGLGQDKVEEQLLLLHPDLTVPDQLKAIAGVRAIALLSAAQSKAQA